MPNCKPNPGKDKPDYISNYTQYTRPNILALAQFISTYCLSTKGQKSELTYYKTGFSPRNAYNRYQSY